MKNNLFYIISPCVIVFVVLALGMLNANAQGGWRMLGVVAGLPILLMVGIAGVLTKLLIRKNNAALWITEFVIIAATFIVLHTMAQK